MKIKQYAKIHDAIANGLSALHRMNIWTHMVGDYVAVLNVAAAKALNRSDGKDGFSLTVGTTPSSLKNCPMIKVSSKPLVYEAKIDGGKYQYNISKTPECFELTAAHKVSIGMHKIGVPISIPPPKETIDFLKPSKTFVVKKGSQKRERPKELARDKFDKPKASLPKKGKGRFRHGKAPKK